MITAKPSYMQVYRTAFLVVLLTPCTLFGQHLPTAKPEEVGVSSEKVAKLSEFMQSLVDDGKIAGGVTMMARHSKVVHFEAVGWADREEQKPMQKDSIFRIASMTKPITSVAVMMLYDEGKLDLDDPVSKYIPEFKTPKVLTSTAPLKTEFAGHEIKIRHLLTHTSGIGYNSTDDLRPIYAKSGIISGLSSTDITLKQMMTRLGRLPLLFPPGDRWHYSLSVDVLGRVVEVVSEEPLDRFIQERLCRPLGMKDTFFIIPHGRRDRLVSAYLPTDEGIRKVAEGEELIYRDTPVSADYHLESNRYRSGGAGLSSTPTDYMRFCQMMLNGGQLDGVRVLRTDTVKMMTTNQIGKSSGGVGFGFAMMADKSDVHEQLRLSYTWGGFWSTSFRISPRGDWSIVTMSQVGADAESPPWGEPFENIAAEAIMK